MIKCVSQFYKKEGNKMNEYMKKAKEEALEGMTNNHGGPFGAVITDKNGTIIATRS